MSIPDFSTAVQREFNRLILGDFLGRGVYRAVYVYKPDPKLVIKIETEETKCFSNVMEWTIWQELRETKWADYLAPCVQISHFGSVLVQTRTRPITKMPSNLPNFMTDLKLGNFGRLGKRIVAHDYAGTLFFSNALRSVKMQKRL